MEEFGLRRTLSDELHARAFHDFEGAGRFIRYVFLTDGDTGAILDYVNAFLEAAGRAPIPGGNKFLRLDMDGYALRVEQHTEFMSMLSTVTSRIFRLPGRGAFRRRSFMPSGWKSVASRRAA